LPIDNKPKASGGSIIATFSGYIAGPDEANGHAVEIGAFRLNHFPLPAPEAGQNSLKSEIDEK
jgi:hypothetical protein